MKTKVINMFGGPSSGKSTTAAELFAHLKKQGYNCELVSEFAKDEVWSENFNRLNDQIHVFGNHHHRFWRLIGKVDVIITDSPIIMSLAYTPVEERELSSLIKRKFEEFENFNVWINRSSDYNPVGRTQTEDEAKVLDGKIHKILFDNGVIIDTTIDKFNLQVLTESWEFSDLFLPKLK